MFTISSSISSSTNQRKTETAFKKAFIEKDKVQMVSVTIVHFHKYYLRHEYRQSNMMGRCTFRFAPLLWLMFCETKI